MAYSRLLLLLIGVISTHLPEVHARSIDYWCKYDSRKQMMEREMGMIKEKCAPADWVDELPSPVQIPCVGLHMPQWTNKTLQQKHAEVLGALQVFQVGVQNVTSQVKLKCHTSLLKRLEHSIRSYLTIVNSTHIQSDRTPSHSAVEHCSSLTSLNNVLNQYENLLNGKLKHLADDVQDIVCK